MADAEGQRPGIHFSSGITPGGGFFLNIERVSGYDPHLERLIRGRIAFQDRNTELARSAVTEGRPTAAIIAVRKVLEGPDLSRLYQDPNTTAQTLDHMNPGILTRFQKEIETERQRILDDPEPSEEVADLLRQTTGLSLKQLRLYGLGSSGLEDKVSRAAFSLDYDVQRELREIDGAAREEIGTEPGTWAAEAERLKNDGQLHDAGLAKQEEGRAALTAGNSEQAVWAFGDSYASLRAAGLSLPLDLSDEDLMAAREIRAQMYGVTKETVATFKAKQRQPGDVPHLGVLANRLIEMGFPPSEFGLMGHSNTQSDYLRLLVDAATMGRDHSKWGSRSKGKFKRLERAARYTHSVIGALEEDHIVATYGDTDPLEDTLVSNGARLIVGR